MPRPVAVFMPELHDRGGAERATIECLRRWSETRSVVVYTRVAEPVVLPGGVNVIKFKGPRKPHLLGFLSFFLQASLTSRRLRRMPLANRPIVFSPGVNLVSADVTVSHICFGQTAEVLALSDESAIRVGGSREALRRIHANIYAALLRRIELGFYRRSRFVLAVSRTQGAWLEGRGIKLDGIAPNGVDASIFQPGPDRESASPLSLVAIGSEIEKKGLDIAVLAAAEMSQHRDVSLTIVTRPQNAEPLRRLARESGFSRLSVHTESVAGHELFEGHDLYIASSREDSFNMPALEAMCCGIPVVLSAKCGLADFTPPEVELRLPNVKDFVAGIEAVVLSTDANVRSNLRTFARTMTWDVPATAVEQCFATLD